MTEHAQTGSERAWQRYVQTVIGLFAGGLVGLFGFVVLTDPFGISPVALPLKPSLVTTQRYVYPQIVRSRQYDALLVGTSTTMLIDPQHLNAAFDAKFANLAMASATAWEQVTLLNLFLRETARPKVVIFGLDTVWCEPKAATERITFRGFPEWLYDDARWNDFSSLLNRLSLASALRKLRVQFGLYTPDIRPDGMQKFLPDDSEYDPARARQNISHGAAAAQTGNATEERPADAAGRASASNVAGDLPALAWLDDVLSRLPATTTKVLAFMPVHQSALELPAGCKERVAAIGHRHGATVIDWRIESTITRETSNYWDRLHYRVPIADKIARELPGAVLSGRTSPDNTYVLLGP